MNLPCGSEHVYEECDDSRLQQSIKKSPQWAFFVYSC